MKVTSVHLDNFQSYSDEDITFEEGVSLLHGDNGAGKSTVLRAIFAGLFQTDMSRHASSDFNSIGELVRQGEEEGGVTLTFEVGADEYELEWTITVDDPDAEEPTGSTKECVLKGTSLQNPIDGVTSVRDAIQNEIIGMDAQAFTNSVYVQQNEVMKLITADEGDRKRIFDDLLGLSEIDSYIDRTVELRREAKAKRDEAAAQRDEVQTQLEEQYPERSELAERQQRFSRELNDAKQTRDELEEEVNSLKDERDEIQDRINNYGDLEDKKEALETKLEELNTKLQKAEDSISSLDDEIEEHEQQKWTVRRKLNELDSDVDEYDLTDVDAVDTAENEIDDKFVEKSQEQTQAKQQLETAKSDLKESEEEKDDLESLHEDLQTQKEYLQNQLEETEEELEVARNKAEKARETRDTLVQEFLEASPDQITQETRETVEDRISQLDSKREDARNKTTRLSAKKENAEQELQRLTTKIEEVKDEREETLKALPDEIQDAESGEDASVMESRISAAQDAANELSIFTSPTVNTDNLETLRDKTLPEMMSELNDMYSKTIDEYADLAGEEKHLETRLSELQQIKKTGECPICGETISDDSNHHEEEHTRVANELGEVQCERVEVTKEREQLETERSVLETVRERISEAILVRSLAEYDSELETLSEQSDELENKIEQLNREIEETNKKATQLENQVTHGKQDVLGAFEEVDAARERLDTIETAVEEAETDVEGVENDIQEVEDDLSEIESQISDLEETVETRTEALKVAEREVETIQETRETIQTARQLHNTLEDHEQTIENKKSEKKSKKDVLQAIREQRGEVKSNLDTVVEKLEQADLDDLHDEKGSVESDLSEVQSDYKEAKEEVTTLNSKIAKVENKLESYDQLAQRVSELDAKMSEANDYVEEMNDIINTYEDVKLRLRKENLKLINGYANQIFRELYHSASYERIILNDDYTLSLLKSDGSRISPKLSSGGESAIVNIALRAGVYRTIAERNQTASSGLPPFILDEPTTFLDEGHVQELEQAIQTIRDWDVSQVIVVSHHDALIDAADYEYEVTKDSTTDTSTCKRRNSGTVV